MALSRDKNRNRWKIGTSFVLALVALAAFIVPGIIQAKRPMKSKPIDQNQSGGIASAANRVTQLEAEQSKLIAARDQLEDQLDQAIAARTAVQMDVNLQHVAPGQQKQEMQQQLDNLAGKIRTEQRTIDRLNTPVVTDSPEVRRAKTHLAAAQATLRDLLKQKKQQQPGKKLNPDWEDIKQKRDSLQAIISQRTVQIIFLQKDINKLQKEADDAENADTLGRDKRREIRERTQQLSDLNLAQSTAIAERNNFDSQLQQTLQYLTDDTPSSLDQRIKTQQDIVADSEKALRDALEQHPNSNMVDQDAINEHEDIKRQLETERVAVANRLKRVDDRLPPAAAPEVLRSKLKSARKLEADLRNESESLMKQLKLIKQKLAEARRSDTP
jgi:chromosome segregation ATPase